jgi:uridine kinase
MLDPELPLAGGHMTTVVRLGDTVRRSTGPWSPAVHCLLRHLESATFAGAPRFLGVDPQGQEVLSFIDGEAGFFSVERVVPPGLWSDQVVIEAARLLRRLHDATIGLRLPLGVQWHPGWPCPTPHEVICHTISHPYGCRIHCLWNVDAQPSDDLIVEIRRRRARGRGPFLVALDERSGAGKSTLAAYVADHVGATVISGDDFYSGGTDTAWLRLTAAERADRCIDWRRLRTEVLEPLHAGRPADWHPFDFAAGEGLAGHTIHADAAPVIILDGVYSGRPELREHIDLAVLVDAPDDQVRRERLVTREGAPFMAAWHALWDVAEDFYFTHVCPPESFDLVVVTAQEGDSTAGRLPNALF